jgi:hypothetical protein
MMLHRTFRTTLKGEISDRVAGVINRCGFDMG